MESVTNCNFYYIVSLEINTWLFEGFLKIDVPHGTMGSPFYSRPPSYDSLKEALAATPKNLACQQMYNILVVVVDVGM